MPIELLTMLFSGIFGFISKMWANSSKDKADQHRMMLEAHTANRKAIQEARKFDTPQSNMMRRFIVIALFAMLAVLLVGGIFTETNILVESGRQSFLGLFEYGEVLEVIKVEGLVAYPWMHHAVLSIISFYFGTGAAKR